MTQVITRYFDSAEQALAVRRDFVHRRQYPMGIVHVFDTAKGLTEQLTKADVDEKTAKAYEKLVAKQGAVLMVRAGYKPLRVAHITREVTAEMGAKELPGMVEEVSVKEALEPFSPSILRNHPHMLTFPRDPHSNNYHMANWPIPLISRRKPYAESIFPRHARMANFPIPLTDRRKPYTGSIIPRHGRMADKFLPLTSRRKPYTGSIISRHGRMANFILPLISRRKPYSKTLIGRHTRMANWPIPHLIDGEMGTNSLMPDGPRMANFPIPLLSNRKPKDKFAFPRHKRMANFPIPLTSRRKPFNGSMIERHGRMANAFLPLVIKHGVSKGQDGGKSFSFSKMLGLPTLTQR